LASVAQQAASLELLPEDERRIHEQKLVQAVQAQRQGAWPWNMPMSRYQRGRQHRVLQARVASCLPFRDRRVDRDRPPREGRGHCIQGGDAPFAQFDSGIHVLLDASPPP